MTGAQVPSVEAPGGIPGGPSRKERIAQVRARLAELVASGEIARIEAERPIPHPYSTGSAPTDAAGFVHSLLMMADTAERADAARRETPQWRELAHAIAVELERIAAWAGVG